ncbi:hypothetical protein E3P89_01287 [Wallemia ichthyophaga]|uniref:tRNA (adenine(58)-N(1))-methyltransferase catalytic subunit TRM61 n=1 Tax=Wallemia ichthyophaga TaxID=245174 RepID=A0A4T0I9M2_WALIC|nr:hypothetical protein E3P90_01687 [Wallemia ichthyophaga]TIB14992.1 hypothetical protein E3P93_01437 [Wallemia ichthyophaga]TIB23944.1 hypothetical protein E3P89_01287 [Wallemia ichthyophaga]TIB25333.1 hypothetical protein E3P88_01642 [Wallemia ichthyophaga]
MINNKESVIKENDLVIIWLTRDQLSLIRVEEDKIFQNKFGNFKHKDIIGRCFGDKLSSNNNRGFIHLLKPSPELWTLALPHRTQILYNTDISFILLTLNIKPGSKVIESGTGSGSFSHSVARSIGTRGQLHSFEYHQSRCQKAQLEFNQHGLSDIINVYHRDSCRDGFPSHLNNSIDSIFLDLPMPWLAIPHAKKSLRNDKISRICCFSPCIEQVLKTTTTLNSNGFTNVTMFEVLSRNYDTSYTHLPNINDVTNKLKAILKKKEFRRQQQIAAAQKKLELKLNEAGGEAGDESLNQPVNISVESEQTSKRKLDETSSNIDDRNTLLSRPFMDTRGHTSYLTFASLLPYDFDENLNDEKAVNNLLL